MKIFTVLLFILAVLGAQAKFNLRTYAHQKLQAVASESTNDHVIHTDADIADMVDSAVNECFDAQLGKDNAVISNTRSATEFDVAAAIDGINLCLQNQNLRLGHSVDAGLKSSMDDVVKAAIVLNQANEAYNTLIEDVTPGLKDEMGKIGKAVVSAETELKTAYKASSSESSQQSAKSLEDFLRNKKGEYDHVLTSLSKKFTSFSSETEADITALGEKIAAVKIAEGFFDGNKTSLSSNKGNIITAIKGHYKEVINGTDTATHAVSGRSGEGCGKLTDLTESATVEEKVVTMCNSGLKCVLRNQAVVDAMTKSERKNLKYSGSFVCSSYANADATESSVAPNCEGYGSELKAGIDASSTDEGNACNLRILSGLV